MPPLDMAIMQRGAPVSPPPPGQVSGSTHQQWQRRGVLGAESDLQSQSPTILRLTDFMSAL